MMAKEGIKKIYKKSITQIYLITLVSSSIVLLKLNNYGGLKEVNLILEISQQLEIRLVEVVRVT